MRRLFGLAVTLGMLAAFAAVPAHAQAPPGCAEPVPGHTYTCTVHMTSGTQTMPVTPIACPDGSTVPGGLLTITINNGVFHITINKAGDLWDTGTIEGTFVFVADNGLTYTGHFTQWFGDSVNNLNEVHHFTASFVGSAPNGSRISLHFDFHFSTSATPSGPANIVVFDKVHC
jgi:hypothetical protein